MKPACSILYENPLQIHMLATPSQKTKLIAYPFLNGCWRQAPKLSFSTDLRLTLYLQQSFPQLYGYHLSHDRQVATAQVSWQPTY